MPELRDMTFRRPLVLAALVLPVAMLGAACGDETATDSPADTSADQTETTEQPAEPAPAIVATTSIWADVTSQVACGEAEVSTLIPVGTDAHSYEPSVQDADLLSSADLIVANGLMLEEGAVDMIETAETDGVAVLELAESLDPIEGGGHSHSEEKDGEHSHSEDEHSHSEDEHSHSDEEGHDHSEEKTTEKATEEEGHSHSGGMDPHVWMDPERVAKAVPLIAEQLRGLDGLPIDEARLDECAADYAAELMALSTELAAEFESLPAERRKLVTNHEALAYLADRFGFEIVGAIVPSTSSLGESNVRDLEELAEKMEAEGVDRIYGEVTGSDEVSAALAERLGSPVQIIELFTESLGDEGSGAETYVGMMRTNGGLITSD